MSLSTLDLNLLLVLDTVLRERSVARAAQRLHVTPSAISNGLAKLRVALGDALVTRKGRGIVPTPRAKELAPALSRAMAELERVVSHGPFDASSSRRTFTLAMADALQIAWLPRISALLARAMPLSRLRVVGIDSLLTLGDLSSSEVDLHVGVRATGAGVHAEPLYVEQTVLVAARRNPICARRPSRRQLAALSHVAVELAPGRGFRDPVARAYARAKLERRVAVSVPSFSVAATIAASSELVATLPRSLFDAHAAPLGLEAVGGPVPRHQIAMALCWHERTHQDPAAQAFRALVRDAIASVDH